MRTLNHYGRMIKMQIELQNETIMKLESMVNNTPLSTAELLEIIIRKSYDDYKRGELL